MKKHNLKIDFIAESLKIALHHSGGNCHENSALLFDALTKLGYDVKLFTGVFMRDDGVNIKHSWLEFEGKILETDTKQLHIESELSFKIIEDEEIKKRYICQRKLK